MILIFIEIRWKSESRSTESLCTPAIRAAVIDDYADASLESTKMRRAFTSASDSSLALSSHPSLEVSSVPFD